MLNTNMSILSCNAKMHKINLAYQEKFFDFLFINDNFKSNIRHEK
jgi:hypothetical protein